MPDMEFGCESETESETGPVFYTVWALIMSPIDDSPEGNWVIATSDENGLCWFWWELVKLDSGGFDCRCNESNGAPANAGRVFLGEIVCLDALELGQTITQEVEYRAESWTSREFVWEIWDTLYQDEVLSKIQYGAGVQRLRTAAQGLANDSQYFGA